MPRTTLAVFLVLTCLPGSSLAQAGSAGTKDHLEALRAAERRPELLGEYRFGVYEGTQPMGETTVRVEAAPAKSGATYRVAVVSTWDVEAVKGTRRQALSLAADLSLVSSSFEEQGEMFGKERSRTSETTFADGVWTQRAQSKGEPPRVLTLTSDEPTHDETWSWLLLARTLDRSKPVTHRLRFAWFDEDEPKTEELTLEVIPNHVAELPHRGRVRGCLMRAEGVLKESALLDAEGRVLAYWVGHERRAGLHLALAPGEEPPQPGADDQALRAHLQLVFSFLADPSTFEALSAVCDWPRIQRAAAAKEPPLGELEPEAFRRALVARVEARPFSMPPSMQQTMVKMIPLSIEDEVARTTERPEIKFARDPGGPWRIVALPIPPAR